MTTDGPSKLAMPTAKEKGGSPSHRYRPASEYDDATLTQKRQYWRTKKREQRARLTERRGKLLHLHGPAVGAATLSDPFAAFAPPLQSDDDSCKTLAVSGNTDFGASSVKAADNQKEKWLHTMKLDRVSPQLPASCSIAATARGPVSRAATSPTPSGPPLHPRPSVPPVRVTGTTNGSAAEATPQSCVSMQGASVPNAQHKAQVALRILPTHMTGTGMLLLSSPCGSVKTEGGPQSGTKSALVTLQRPTGGSNARSLPEEERAARRREQWRIKKREQRAKVAAQIARARERTQSAAELTFQRQTAQHAGLVGGKPLQHLPPPSFLRGAGQRPCAPRARTSFTSARRGHYDLQSVAGRFATVNLPADRIMVPNPHGYRTTPPALTCDAGSVRKPAESMRKFPGYGHLSNVARGIARCRTPRQRFIDAQKSFMNQRNLRCRSPLLSSVFHTRNMPQIDPNDTPGQIIAKRREYWRIKKREQRAKLSMEVKSRLKERDSLMRRMKRYQSILEEMRRARALAQSAGSGLAHETIGGFIKEDGTLTVHIPQAPSLHHTDCQLLLDDTLITRPQHQPSPHGVTSPVRVTPPPLLRPARVKVSFPLAGQSVNEPPGLTRASLGAPAPHMLAIQTVSQITLTHPQTPHGAASGVRTAAPNLRGCIMKMAVSSNLSSLSLDPNLTEEERMAKKREYWRIKKREQRAARASRLKQGVLQARASATLQRRRAQKLGAITSAPLGRSLPDHTGNAQSLPNDTPATPHANEIKQESESLPDVDLHSPPEHALCPDIKAPSSPPPVPPAEPDPALNAECQATTLLAVASMKKLLEESLSTVAECSGEPTAIKTEEASEQEMEPRSPPSEAAPVAADLTVEIKSWPPESDASLRACSPSPPVEDSLPPLPSSSEVVLPPTCEHSSQTLSNFIVNPGPEAASPRRAQRLRAKQAGLQSGKLHHAPLDRPQPRQPPREQREECHNSTARPAQGHLGVGAERGGSFSLQRKREYWKLMKRQQRARVRARQKDRQGECSGRLAQRNMQVMLTR